MLKQAKISQYRQEKILKYFCKDISASTAAKLLGFNRKTLDLYYGLFREAIMRHSIEEQSKQFNGEVEIDESYFGARRVRGKRGRGAAGKTPVFGILKREGKVFVAIVKNCSKAELMPIIQGKILEGSTIHSDGWKSYDGLILNGYDHYRVYHSKNEFVRGKAHVNGIESFWSFAKRRLSKFNGVASHKFHIYLKECEFRWNHRNDDLYAIMLQILPSN
ncbi:MAG: IS1595 family transposase [Candidatus Peregrinibacteria bacterium]|nr:IS1595 family transposase [Candidatus Peregrinibacteria bacterium]